MIRPILQQDDPRLREHSAAVRLPLNTEARLILADLKDTMLHHKGAGLSAIQLGVPLQIIALNPRMVGGFSAMINPRIFMRSPDRESGPEGCFSIGWGKPRFPVMRSKRICVEFFDRNGKQRRANAEGYAARIIQHECDHLRGRLITDKEEPMPLRNEVKIESIESREPTVFHIKGGDKLEVSFAADQSRIYRTCDDDGTPMKNPDGTTVYEFETKLTAKVTSADASKG